MHSNGSLLISIHELFCYCCILFKQLLKIDAHDKVIRELHRRDAKLNYQPCRALYLSRELLVNVHLGPSKVSSYPHLKATTFNHENDCIRKFRVLYLVVKWSFGYKACEEFLIALFAKLFFSISILMLLHMSLVNKASSVSRFYLALLSF